MSFANIDEFLDQLDRMRNRTLRVASVIPPANIEWRYADNSFSFGDIIRHLANIERYVYAETARFRPQRYPGHSATFASGYDEIMNYFRTLHDESVEIFKQVTMDDLMKKCHSTGGFEVTLWKFLRSMLEHEAHHRGQIYMMLAALDITTPPLFGVTSEELIQHGETDQTSP